MVLAGLSAGRATLNASSGEEQGLIDKGIV